MQNKAFLLDLQTEFISENKEDGSIAQLDTCLPAGREQRTKVMTYKVYVLRSINFNRFYIGFTNDLDKRLLEHNSSKTKSTSAYKPWKLFFYQEYETREEARNREKYLKSGVGREYIKNRWFHSSTG